MRNALIVILLEALRFKIAEFILCPIGASSLFASCPFPSRSMQYKLGPYP
jgi:hypothetical protein